MKGVNWAAERLVKGGKDILWRFCASSPCNDAGTHAHSFHKQESSSDSDPGPRTSDAEVATEYPAAMRVLSGRTATSRILSNDGQTDRRSQQGSTASGGLGARPMTAHRLTGRYCSAQHL